MKRLAALAAVVGLWGCALADTGQAGPGNYTDQPLAGSQLGLTPLGNALVSLTFAGDTSTVTGGTVRRNATPTATVNARGVGTTSFAEGMEVGENRLSQSFAFDDVSISAELPEGFDPLLTTTN
jgi:hypothetical protein